MQVLKAVLRKVEGLCQCECEEANIRRRSYNNL